MALYSYLNKKNYIFSILLLLTMLVHPNSGVFLIAIYLIATLILIYYKKATWRNFIMILLAGFIGVIPTLFKLSNIPSIELVTNTVWYANMIKDEADDFSPLYQILYNYNLLIQFLLTLIFTIWAFYKVNVKDSISQILAILVILPVVLFIFLLVLELFSVYTGYMLFISPVIALQPGHKLLSFAVFPLVFLWGRLFQMMHLNIRKDFFLFLVVSVSMLFFAIIVWKGKVLNQLKYVGSLHRIDSLVENSYKDMLIVKSLYKGRYSSIGKNPSLSAIFHDPRNEIIHDYNGELNLINIYNIDSHQPKLQSDIAYFNKYDNISVFESLILAINNNIPNGSGIIIPPYLINMRDSLPKYDIFFQEHHDGNLMMGNKKIATIMLTRMNDLLGVDYTEMPTHNSGYNYTYMRKLYLDLNKEEISRIRNKHTHYEYFITESSKMYKLPVIYKNEHYTIFKL
jgi:hypothetical protein